MNATVKVDTEFWVGRYVVLRDEIKKRDDAHKEAMAPLRETLEQLNGVLLDALNKTGGESVRTNAGTVYKTEKKSASIADKTAFWTHVVVTADWDLIDYKANPVAVAEYIEKQVEAAKDDPTIQPTPPPGVNYSTKQVVGVRRS